MNKIYVLQYIFNKDGVFGMSSKNAEKKTETFTGEERKTWIERYQKVVSDDIYKKDVKCFFIKLCDKSVIELDSDQMKSVIDGI